MIQEAIILAGGLGTRLKAVVSDVPKSLAPVGGRPFLSYLIDYARQQGVEKFIFATGYKSDQIEHFVQDYLPSGSFRFSAEQTPLGTGGAIYKACAVAESENVLVLNADTFFGVSFETILTVQKQPGAECTLALKPMRDFDRYGIVELGPENRVTGFSEKKFHASGLINGGVYALSVAGFKDKTFSPVFSFEKDYLEKQFSQGHIRGVIADDYFIDIGVPADYERAQIELIQHISIP